MYSIGKKFIIIILTSSEAGNFVLLELVEVWPDSSGRVAGETCGFFFETPLLTLELDLWDNFSTTLEDDPSCIRPKYLINY